MSTPKAVLPGNTSELYAAIGQLLHKASLAKLPPHVRDLLPVEDISDRTAIATTNDWRDKHNLILHRLAKLAEEALKGFRANKPNAIQIFGERLESEYDDVGRFLNTKEAPHRYLTELIIAHADDAEQFRKLLELLVRLGKEQV